MRNINIKKTLALAPLLTLSLALALLASCDKLVTEVTEVTVAGHPTAEFALDPASNDSGCVPLTVTFRDLSDGPRDKWLWTFGDGDSSTDSTPTHTYDSAGVFRVTLRITDTQSGGTDTEVKNRFIIVGTSELNLGKSVSRGCFPLSVDFTGSGTGVTSYLWRFDDGTTSSAQNPTHVFTTADTFVITMVVNGACGPDSVQDTLIVDSCVTVEFQVQDDSSGCAPATFTFLDSTQALMTNPIASRVWDFGDGTVVTNGLNTEMHTYSQPGQYTVKLATTFSDGAVSMDSSVGLITVYDSLSAGFRLTSAAVACTSSFQQFVVKFADTSKGNVVARKWDFGDGIIDSTSNDPNPAHAYLVAGSYDVSLEVTGTCGSDTTTEFVNKNSLITLMTAPSTNPFTLSTDMADTNQVVIFGDTVSLYVNSRSWDFGDGSPVETAADVTHSYTTSGVYEVRLTRTGTCGSSVIIDTVTVQALTSN